MQKFLQESKESCDKLWNTDSRVWFGQVSMVSRTTCIQCVFSSVKELHLHKIHPVLTILYEYDSHVLPHPYQSPLWLYSQVLSSSHRDFDTLNRLSQNPAGR